MVVRSTERAAIAASPAEAAASIAGGMLRVVRLEPLNGESTRLLRETARRKSVAHRSAGANEPRFIARQMVSAAKNDWISRSRRAKRPREVPESGSPPVRSNRI